MAQDQAIIEAASDGDLGQVQELLDTGVDVDTRSDDAGTTPLGWACVRGDIAMAEMLLEHGADPNIVNVHGVRPIHVAIEKAPYEIIAMLLDANADASAAWEGGQRPLHIAAKAGRADVAAALIAHGADVDAAEDDGARPLHHAALGRSLGVARCLLEAGADANALGSHIERPALTFAIIGKDNDPKAVLPMVELLLQYGADPRVYGSLPWPPMYQAITTRQYEVAAAMLPAWGDVNVAQLDGLPLLHWACDSGTASDVAFFLQHGGDPNGPSEDRHRRALHYAVNSDDDGTVCEQLIAAGADPSPADDEGTTPLHLAAFRSNIDAARVLLDDGADPTAVQVQFGYSPLDAAISIHLAFSRGLDVPDDCPDLPEARPELMRLLVSRGSPVHDWNFARLALLSGDADVAIALLPLWGDPNVPDTEGLCLLSRAAEADDEHVVRRLLEMGADPNLQDGDRRRSALHRAAGNGAVASVAVLLEAGADANARDGDGLTPLHCAVGTRNTEATRILLQHGADPNAEGKLFGDLERAKVVNGRCTPLDLIVGLHLDFVREALAVRTPPPDPTTQMSWIRMAVAEGDEDSPARRTIARLLVAAGGRANEHRLAINALLSGDREMADALLPLWRDPNRPEPDGTSVLHFAAGADDAYVAGKLLEMGADPHIEVGPPGERITAIDVARHNGHTEMLRILTGGAVAERAYPPITPTAPPPPAPVGKPASHRVASSGAAARTVRRSRVVAIGIAAVLAVPLLLGSYSVLKGLVGKARGGLGPKGSHMAFAAQGVWRGQYDGCDAALVVEGQKGSEFNGELKLEGGAYRIRIKGFVKPGTDNVSLRETRVTKQPSGKNWALGRSTGYLSKNCRSMSGTGTDGKGKGYEWSLTREGP